ncbi:MAG: sigma-70 family RNA polymerase sigma factor [Gemmatimonadaceae bacterium]
MIAPDAPDTAHTSDARLVAWSLDGDSAAFETLVRRHYRAAYAVALALTGERADAEDVCQDAFVRCWERLHECHDPRRFAAWLVRIVRNRAHNLRDYLRVRRAAPLDAADSAAGPHAPDSPARDVERAELAEHLLHALGHLSVVRRQVVLLHDLEGWRHREIAEALGISEVMSRRHLTDARRLLREQLGAHSLTGNEGHEHD